MSTLIHNLSDSSWTFDYRDPAWIVELVIDALSYLAHIDDFHFRLTMESTENVEQPSAFPLHRLPPLRHLRVELQTRGMPNGGPLQSLTQLITKSPDLSSLHLKLPCGIPANETGYLDDLLRDVPALEALTHLGVHLGVLCLGGQLTRNIQHFRSLSSLELDGADPGLWAEFLKNRIHLRNLVTRQPDDALLDYLSSYSGAEHFKVGPYYGNITPQTEDLASRFFRDVLPCHLETLQTLDICPPHRGPSQWSFQDTNVDVISRCTHLTQLAVGINSEYTKKFTGRDAIVESSHF